MNAQTKQVAIKQGWDVDTLLDKQEPVAWMEDSIEFYAKDHPTNSCTIPLYTAPPSKPWVSLTDEEIANCGWCDLRFARAVEAKLKEKNT